MKKLGRFLVYIACRYCGFRFPTYADQITTQIPAEYEINDATLADAIGQHIVALNKIRPVYELEKINAQEYQTRLTIIPLHNYPPKKR